MPDVLILGAGAIGCATALELARSGRQVTVLDRGPAGGESSWAGAGLLFPLLPWDYRPEVAGLAQAGRRLFGEWVAELSAASGVDPEYIESGLLVLPPYDRMRAFAWAAAEQETLAEVSPRLVEPAVARPGPALWLPQVAQVRNPRLIAALKGALAAAGVKLMENAGEVRWLTANDTIAGVVLADGRRIESDVVVVAAGAWSAELLTPLGPVPPIRPVKGQMLLYRLAPGAFSRIVLQEGVYVIPRRDGHVLVGSTLEETGFDKALTAEARADLARRAAAMVPLLAGLEPVRQWAGLRPGSPDNVPVMDRHPRYGNLWVNSGHFRYGVTMAPAAARFIADRILGRPPLLDPHAYAWRT